MASRAPGFVWRRKRVSGPDDRRWFLVGEDADYWDDEASADP
jgi:hypothetical protein